MKCVFLILLAIVAMSLVSSRRRGDVDPCEGFKKCQRVTDPNYKKHCAVKGTHGGHCELNSTGKKCTWKADASCHKRLFLEGDVDPCEGFKKCQRVTDPNYKKHCAVKGTHGGHCELNSTGKKCSWKADASCHKRLFLEGDVDPCEGFKKCQRVTDPTYKKHCAVKGTHGGHCELNSTGKKCTWKADASCKGRRRH